MNFKKKAIAVFILFSIVLGGVYIPAQKASAGGVFGITFLNVQDLIQWIKKNVIRVLARKMLTMLTNSLIKKIQGGGRDGGAAFVRNWRNFITDSQYRGEDIFKTVLASTPVCNYLDKSIKDAFRVGDNQKISFRGNNVRVGDLDPFNLRAACTLPNSFDMAAYRNDFVGNGGWEAWSRLMEPQNNLYGLLAMARDELSKQRDLAKEADLAEVSAGSGYTSLRDGCQDIRDDTEYTCGGESSGTCPAGQQCETTDGQHYSCQGTSTVAPPSNARCSFMGKVFTPADLLGKTAASTIDKEMGWLVNSQEIADIVVAILNAVIDRLGNLAESKLYDPEAGNDGPQRNYSEEFCTAREPSAEANTHIQQYYPDAYAKFPPTEDCWMTPHPNPSFSIAGGLQFTQKKCGLASYCSTISDNDQDNPYQRQECISECFKATSVLTPRIVNPSPIETGPPSSLELAICRGTKEAVEKGATNPYVGALGANCTPVEESLSYGPNTCLSATRVQAESIRKTDFPGCVPQSDGKWPANNMACQQAMQKICRVSFCAHTKQSSTWWGWNDSFPEVNPNGNFYADRTVPASTVSYFCQNNIGWWGFNDSRFLPKDQTVCSSTDSKANGYLGNTTEDFKADVDNPLVKCEEQKVMTMPNPITN